MGGNQKAQEALRQVLPPGHKNLDAYRKLLYAHGAQEGVGTEEQPVRLGISHEEVEAVWKAGGKLTIGQMVACRVRCFVDGAVLGSRDL